MRGGLGRTLGAGAILFLLLAGLLLALLPSRSTGATGSVFSVEPGGTHALFLLLEELGFQVLPWTRAPGNLPRNSDLLVLMGVPEEPPGYPAPGAGAEDGGARSSARRLRDLRHYLRFVEEGGTIAMGIASPQGEELAFLRDTLGIPEVAGLGLDAQGEGSASLTAVLRSGERLVLARGKVRLAGSLPERAEVLAADEAGSKLAVRIPIGRGALLLSAVPFELLANRSIDREDDALYFVRLIEELTPFERILFDEYALGGWAPDSPLGLALAPGAILFSLHGLALFLLFLWRSAWVGPFPRDPEPLAGVSALARAEGLASAIERAGRWDLLARLARTGVLERWSARAGTGSPVASSTPRDGGRMDPAAVESALTALFQRDPALLERARAAFRRPVRSSQDLAGLDGELRALERAALARMERSRRTPVA